MKTNIALIFYYNRLNKNSFNSLTGALETEPDFDNLKIYFPETKNELIALPQKIIKDYNKIVIGASFFTTQLWEINEIIKKLRKRYGNKIFCLAGGPHPTGDSQTTLEMGFDLIIRGEGEETLIKLLQKLDENEDYTKIEGIGFINNKGKYSENPNRAFVNLNNYPPFGIRHNKFGPIEISRGCPFCCYFCQTPYLFGNQQRHRSIENICKYVQILKEKGIRDIRFIASDAFSYGSPDGKELNLKALEELLKNVKKIVKPKGRIFLGSFPSEVRPEHVTEETINLVSEYTDNDNLIIGAQSGSQRVLDFCHRGHTVQDIYNAVILTIKAGLKANVDFIFGLPGETKEDVELTLKVIQDLIKIKAKIHAHTFMPLPQTPFAKMPAGKIDKSIYLMLKKLAPQKVVYGSWEKQVRLARKIENYFKDRF